jgi:signal peptidase II
MRHLRRAGSLALAAATAAVDLWSKAQFEYPAGPPNFDAALHPTNRTVVENWIYFHTKWNPGAAWSVNLPRWLLLWGTALAVPAIILWIFWPRRASAWDTAAKALVLGGAVGNLYDRWRWDQVRDFVDVVLWGWHYPTFNVADAALVVGILILLLGGLRKRPAEAA